MKRLRPFRLLALALPLSCAGCQAIGGVAAMGTQLVQLALALAATALPFVAWYYYNRHAD